MTCLLGLESIFFCLVWTFAQPGAQNRRRGRAELKKKSSMPKPRVHDDESDDIFCIFRQIASQVSEGDQTQEPHVRQARSRPRRPVTKTVQENVAVMVNCRGYAPWEPRPPLCIARCGPEWPSIFRRRAGRCHGNLLGAATVCSASHVAVFESMTLGSQFFFSFLFCWTYLRLIEARITISTRVVCKSCLCGLCPRV